jgi:hypothetical protein
MKHLLFLHGAGPTTDKTVHQYLEEALLPYNIESCSFDFYGHGEKKIPLSESSLKKRYVEAKQAIQDFHLTEPLNICGSSMGGYIAIKLLEEFKVQNLILFCPAIYDTKAFDVPFDERFTSIIRKEHSWMQTDAFDTFKKFTGNVLIFIGENDEVIPDSLLSMIDTSLEQAQSKELIRIPGCPHTIHRWLSQNPLWAKKVAEKIGALFNN